MHGIIERINSDRGFGFISTIGETRDVFFHVSALVGLPFDESLRGRRVEFQIENSDKGPRAIKVQAAE